MLAFEMQKKHPLTPLMAEANNMMMLSSDTPSYAALKGRRDDTWCHQGGITFKSIPIRMQKHDAINHPEKMMENFTI